MRTICQKSRKRNNINKEPTWHNRKESTSCMAEEQEQWKTTMDQNGEWDKWTGQLVADRQLHCGMIGWRVQEVIVLQWDRMSRKLNLDYYWKGYRIRTALMDLTFEKVLLQLPKLLPSLNQQDSGSQWSQYPPFSPLPHSPKMLYAFV